MHIFLSFWRVVFLLIDASNFVFFWGKWEEVPEELLGASGSLLEAEAALGMMHNLTRIRVWGSFCMKALESFRVTISLRSLWTDSFRAAYLGFPNPIKSPNLYCGTFEALALLMQLFRVLYPSSTRFLSYGFIMWRILKRRDQWRRTCSWESDHALEPAWDPRPNGVAERNPYFVH